MAKCWIELWAILLLVQRGLLFEKVENELIIIKSGISISKLFSYKKIVELL
jgi:hypothetical protein